jgi:hypothetical protein
MLVAEPGRHRRGAAKRLVHPDEVVEHGIEADHPIVRFNFFAEPVGQPREATHPHTEVQVLPFDIGRADVILVRTPFDPGLLDASAVCRAVAPCWAGRIAIHLHQLGVIDIGAERVFNGFQIGFVAIRR